MVVTDVKNDECIHCSTKEEAIAICLLMHKAELHWRSNQKYIDTTNWDSYGRDTVYFPTRGSYCDTSFAKSDRSKIYPASLFLNSEIDIVLW